MSTYDNHQGVLKILAQDQDAQRDIRERITDEVHFVHHPQGQWEDQVWGKFEGRPRYTFDMTKPTIAKIWGEMAANEFAAQIKPNGMGADEENAKIIDGLLRKIYEASSFHDTAKRAGKKNIAHGFACWRAVNEYVGDSFYQDLSLKPITDAHERVWFDCHSVLASHEDAMHVNVLQDVADAMLKERFPKRDGFESIDSGLTNSSYSHKKTGFKTIGEILYKKYSKETRHLLSDGQIIPDAELTEFDQIVTSRDVKICKVYSRMYDGKDWLGDETLTPFKELPIIASYANFEVIEGKVTYEGIVYPMMDACRVHNYAESRKVEETVLGHKSKIFMSDSLAEGYESEISDINKSNNAVQLLNADATAKDGLIAPMLIAGGQGNPALSEVSADMKANIQLITGLPNDIATMEQLNADSDFRAGQRASMGQMGTYEFYNAHSLALKQTAKVLIGAIPDVYDTDDRVIEVMDESGISRTETINTDRPDGVTIDLRKGSYEASIKVGAVFQDRRIEANTKLLEMGERVPGLVERNADILTGNIDAPGMGLVQERERAVLIQQGVIPFEQMTDEEKQAREQAMQQPPQPDPNAMIAEAELKKAEAQAMEAQWRAQEAQAELELKENKQTGDLNIAQYKAQTDRLKASQEMTSKRLDDLAKTVLTFQRLADTIASGAPIAEEALNLAAQQAELIDNQQDQL